MKYQTDIFNAQNSVQGLVVIGPDGYYSTVGGQNINTALVYAPYDGTAFDRLGAAYGSYTILGFRYKLILNDVATSASNTQLLPLRSCFYRT